MCGRLCSCDLLWLQSYVMSGQKKFKNHYCWMREKCTLTVYWLKGRYWSVCVRTTVIWSFLETTVICFCDFLPILMSPTNFTVWKPYLVTANLAAIRAFSLYWMKKNDLPRENNKKTHYSINATSSYSVLWIGCYCSIGAIVMVDCHLGRRDYFGRIMRSCHRVNKGSWEKRAEIWEWRTFH